LGSGKTSLITKIRYGGSLVDELNKSLPEVDKYIIPHEKYGRRPWIIKKIRLSEVFKDSCVIIAILSLITLLGEIYKLFHISNINTVLLYILGVMVVSLLTHTKWSGFVTAICSVALFNFFFTYPYGSLISASQNWITFVIMGIVGLLSSSWTTRLQLQSAYEAKRAERTEILLNASHAFEKTNTLNDVLVVLGHQANELFKRKIVIYPKQKDNLGIPIVFPYGTSNFASSSVPNNERAIANWVLKHNHPAGKMTDTLPREGSWYLPIQEDNNTPVAVMCIILNKEDQFDSLTRNLIVSILDTSTLAIQRIREAEDKRQVALTMRQEKLRYDLLRGISHDLRTPLTTISGNADMIRSQGDKLSIAQIKELAQSIYNDSNWLTQMVENLLSMTRITNGKFKITRRPELISEIFNEALDHIAPGSETHKIIVKVPNDLLMVNVDAQLIMQVIINIVNNAIQYSPEDSEIDLSVSLKIDKALVTITNNGPQISEEVQKHLFDLFYSQGENSFRRHGMGIGLALCQTIIHASGGDIGVYNRIPRGVSFYFTLPVWEAKK
jgi:two-component system sensor histidine kinase KdpD